MNQEAFLQRLAQKKMIASVKEAKVLEKALAADVGAVAGVAGAAVSSAANAAVAAKAFATITVLSRADFNRVWVCLIYIHILFYSVFRTTSTSRNLSLLPSSLDYK